MDRDAEILFSELADLSRAEREEYFHSRDVPPELRAEVESLLEHDSESHQEFEDCIGRSAADALNNRMVDRRFGPYRLVHLLGRGGMSSVYLAERADGEVQQNVAVKLLRYGGSEQSFRERFLRERQILASLNHPGIARLLDVGHTMDGHPYIVMEHIDGTPIDAFASTLDLRGRLKLFLEVCDAVSYAHRNLVIHRDLKPSNILVDAAGRPKLLDFGIAKILDAGLDQTQTRERLLTPDYASPEQVRGDADSTSSDVYSLGAVLYALLTGQSPHALPGEGKARNVEAIICSREPAPASRLNPELPKDLDFILAKALRKEPEERYPSVEALAEDLRAFLEWRPVRARSGNAWYRTRKFVRRYRLLVAAAALTLSGLSIGLYVANRERALAQRRFLQVRQMASKWIDLDEDVRGLRNSVSARKRIISTSLEYLARIGAEAGADRELNLEIAAEYLHVARLQGVPMESNLGQFAEAEQSLRRAEALADSVIAREPGNVRALQLSAQIAYNRMVLASFQDRNADTTTQARKAIAQLDRLKAAGASVAEYQRIYDDARRWVEQASVVPNRELPPPPIPYAAAPPKAVSAVVSVWGYNEYGQLGTGTFSDSKTPVSFTRRAFVDVAGGWFHSLALDSDGNVWAWGRNSNGQLGLGSLTSSAKPLHVAGLGRVVAIAAGFDHSLAITADGDLWSWGANFTGQLGHGSKIDSPRPVHVTGLKNVVAVDGGGAHSLAALSDGTVWAWGYNSNGQLGHDGHDTTTPVQVPGIFGAVAVAGGGAFSLALKSDGTVWGWGMNYRGELGNGSNLDCSSPVRTAGLTRVVAISAGDHHSLALKSDGTVWAWGWGNEGELGNGSKAATSIPVQVMGLEHVVAISSAPNQHWGHNLALRSDGTVWAWGFNGNGEMGDGTTNNRNIPVQVPGIRGAIRIAAGGGFNIALLAR